MATRDDKGMKYAKGGSCKHEGGAKRMAKGGSVRGTGCATKGKKARGPMA